MVNLNIIGGKVRLASQSQLDEINPDLLNPLGNCKQGPSLQLEERMLIVVVSKIEVVSSFFSKPITKEHIKVAHEMIFFFLSLCTFQ